MTKNGNLIGRVLMAHIFLLAGLSKISGYAATQGYMQSMGVPGALLPLVIVLEVGGALALILGWQTRIAAFALGAFTLVAGVIFHGNVGDQMQMIMLMKNIAITGGLILLGTQDMQGAFSLDARKR
ncbi:MAG: DoxX family protein [Gammaproteobacteria bacterium]|nr:DoxX family protein [Gammaproteobacteria bacterium]